MAIKDKLTDSFVKALKEIEDSLSLLLFKPCSFEKKGYAYFVQYKKGDSILSFLFGPSDYQIEMIIYTSKGKFAFKDLLQNPSISTWVNMNRYTQENERNLKNELLWFLELLKYSLPFVE
jgi:hypothetical protein